MSRKSFFNKIKTPKKTVSNKKTSSTQRKLFNSPKKTHTTTHINIKIPSATAQKKKHHGFLSTILSILPLLPLLLLLGGFWWVLFKFFPEVYSAISGQFQGVWETFKKGYEFVAKPVQTLINWVTGKETDPNTPINKSTQIWTILMGTTLTGFLTHVLKQTVTKNLFLKIGVGTLKLTSRCCFWSSLAYLGWELYQLKDFKTTPPTSATPLQEEVEQKISQTTPVNLRQQLEDFKKKR
ncbi:MAG: hypothetical protein BGWL_c3850 [Candidatus Phytoplasma cynodontis]|nr:MAG: hypothetical protein BGWL_c3850 [Candidatus Phytoplasma cynodontis]